MRRAITAHAGHNVEDGHEGHQIGGHLTDALHAADDHDGGEDGQDDAGPQGGAGPPGTPWRRQSRWTGAMLPMPKQATPPSSENSTAQPLHAGALFNVVHGAAVVGAVGPHLPVLHCQDDLGVLGHHAEEGGHPHPEDRPRAAGKDSAGDAGDVAGAPRCPPERWTPPGRGVRLGSPPAFFSVFRNRGAQGAAHDEAEFPGLQAAAPGQ